MLEELTPAILAGVTSPETAFELFQAREGAVDPPPPPNVHLDNMVPVI